MRYLSKTIDDFDLIDVVYGRAQSTVDAKYGVIDHDAQCEEVEHIGKVLPNSRCAILAGTFKVEAVCLG